MIILREVESKDIDSLVSLSRLAAEFHPGFLNLAMDKDQWKEKISRSTDSFSEKIKSKSESKYIFVAEDTDSGRIVGISMVTGQHGTSDVPHFYFEVGNEQRFSATINTGFIHGTLTLKNDVDGPTEIGGLIVDPEFRHSETKVGRQLSFIRFLYIGLNRKKFKDEVIAELLPPLTKRGKSSLWEAIGRRFTNLDYPEADELSSKNKEFILSLFPSDKIFITFLAAEARNAIGKVSKDTEPVLHMLKKIGFKYLNQVDPFDGGPHLRAKTDEILPLKNIKKYKYTAQTSPASGSSTISGIVNPAAQKKIRAASVSADITGDCIYFDDKVARMLFIKDGDEVFFMPYYN